MSLELVTIIVLLIMFVIGSALPINIGVMGFVAAFVVGSLISGMKVDDIFKAFPGNLFILLTGVTYLFAIVQNNGTIDLITRWGLRLVKGNLGLIPWVMFALSALLASVGTSAIAVVSIIAPIALRLAFQYNISPLLMGILVVTGSTAGSFSPLNIFGLIVNNVMQSKDLPHSPGLLFINTFMFCVVVAILVFIVFGGLRLLKNSAAAQVEVAATVADNTLSKEDGFTLYKGATLAGILILLVLALGFDVNMGFAAFMVALVLALMAPKKQAVVLGRMPWSVILMVTGIVTYVGVLEKIGTIDYMTELISSVDNPMIAALAASYIGGIVSAFASTTGFLAAIIPLATPILQDPTISSIGVISAISISSSIVDLSPFSTNGALLLANVQGMKEREFFTKLLLVSAVVVALGPGLAWLIFVLIA
jgi:Na+/H+ antiporter NhaD/arsenite permease-like protein